MQLPNEILIPQVAELVKKGHTVTLPLKGYSMRPYLEDGRDKALLSSVPKTLHVGDVILAEIQPKRYALHRIIRIEGDIITMYGDGNFSPEYIEKHDVLAIALGFYRKGSEKLEPVDTFSYEMYWKTWVKLRPIRRYLLLIWKMYHYPTATTKHIIKRLLRR